MYIYIYQMHSNATSVSLPVHTVTKQAIRSNDPLLALVAWRWHRASLLWFCIPVTKALPFWSSNTWFCSWFVDYSWLYIIWDSHEFRLFFMVFKIFKRRIWSFTHTSPLLMSWTSGTLSAAPSIPVSPAILCRDCSSYSKTAVFRQNAIFNTADGCFQK